MVTGILTYDFFPIEGGIGNHVYKIYYKNFLAEKEIKFFSPKVNDLKNHYTISPWTIKYGKNISFSLILNLILRKIIRKNDLKKIHIHSGPGGIFLLRKPRKTKVIAIFHHTYWQQKEYIKQQRWKQIFCILEKSTLKKVDQIIAVSKDTRNIIIDKYKIPKSKVKYIPNAVKTDEYFPIRNIDKIPNSILYVGRLDERKGIKFLVESYKKLTETHPEVKLFIIGKGPYSSFIQDYSKKNNLKNLRMLGFIPDEELNEWYNKVTCFVCPSIFEGFGITVIEAMSAGTPVIGTNVDGIRTIIQDGHNGYLIDYGNVTDLVEKLIQVIASDNNQIINNALIKIKSEFSLEAVLESIRNSGIL